MHPLLEDAAQRASAYLDSLPTRPVAPLPAAVARLQELDEALPDGPQSAHLVLQRLDELGSPATAAMAGGRFFGFVIGGALPAALASNWLSTVWDQNAALHGPTPGVAVFEAVALGNPYPAAHLADPAWNQLVLKGFFTGADIGRIVGLEGRRNPELGRMLADYARERRAAHRPIDPRLPPLARACGADCPD